MAPSAGELSAMRKLLSTRAASAADSADSAACTKESQSMEERPQAVKALMRSVLRPLVERLPASQMDLLQVKVKAFMTRMNTPPDLPTFPYYECGRDLIEFCRAMIAEHSYTDVGVSLRIVVKECELREALPGTS